MTKERDRLAGLVLAFLRTEHDARPSFNAMAKHCDVSRTTLRHHFGGVEGAVAAALAHGATSAHVAMLDTELGPLPQSIDASLRLLVHTWGPLGTGELFRTGLLAGLGLAEAAPAMLAHILDPTVEVFARRLARHVDAGELRGDLDPRLGATSLVGPVLLALLHQHQLEGGHHSPLDLDALVTHQVTTFLSAWAVRVEEN